MKDQNFTVAVTVDRTPEEAFKAINNVRGWWSENIKGGTEKLGDEFSYSYKDVHFCKMRLTEVIPGQKVVWLVLDNDFNFTKDKSEWIGNEVIFEISPKGQQTEIRLTQRGLVPPYECFDICAKAWSGYVQGSLKDLIEKGKGQPNAKEK